MEKVMFILSRIVDMIHDMNAYVFYGGFAFINTSLLNVKNYFTSTALGKAITGPSSNEPNPVTINILTASDDGKLLILGYQLTDALYAIFLIVSIICVLIKALIDLHNKYIEVTERKRDLQNRESNRDSDSNIPGAE